MVILAGPDPAPVRRDYAKQQWVRRRCAHARDRVRRHLESIDEGAPVHDRVIARLFGAGTWQCESSERQNVALPI
jgi:hypothetical protein